VTADGPVADFELDRLRADSYARGWRISRTDDGRVTAVREDGGASITTGSVKLMDVALQNERWKPLTGRNRGLPDGDRG
jgi:hypothetical protein